ncbi:hypothetical protein MmiAt1_14360 [Methanimicrococcus sp. At1]|uniref:Uncharacterized protein n=1 Tax=Methanimicrococcus hacksteinii TaxID=3028293 RepID=A0ABU3VQZ8_9EURY|nr:hypothetical protein [Methanimicrococcus sp. At1]MDV0445837.1 hypothetical protein [Methanimicrococcus sp. At1]
MRKAFDLQIERIQKGLSGDGIEYSEEEIKKSDERAREIMTKLRAEVDIEGELKRKMMENKLRDE